VIPGPALTAGIARGPARRGFAGGNLDCVQD